MPWARFDDTFPAHRKVRRLSDGAFRLHVTAVCFSSHDLTDGLITHEDLEELTAIKQADKRVNELVLRGVWEPVADGWIIHDYLDYNPSRKQVMADRSAARERQQRARERRAASQRDARRDSQRESQTPDPTRPDPSPSTTDGLSGAVGPRGGSDAHGDDPELETYAPRARSLDGWKPSERCRRVALTKSLDVDEQRELFSAHARTHNRQVADWDAAFESWLLKSAQLAKAGARPLDRQAEILRREMEAAQAHDAQQQTERLEIEA